MVIQRYFKPVAIQHIQCGNIVKYGDGGKFWILKEGENEKRKKKKREEKKEKNY